MMDRVALITYFAPPILGAESILVAKTVPPLAEFYDLDVITVAEEFDFRTDPALLEMMRDSATVYRYGNRKPRNKIARRLLEKGLAYVSDSHVGWRKSVLRNHPIDRGYKLLYSRSQPGASHLIALEWKRRLGILWVAQFSDPWANNPYHPLPVGQARRIQEQERQVVAEADHLIFPTKEIRDLVAMHHPAENVVARSTILPHCFDRSLYQRENGAESQRRDRIVCSYIGDFYGLRSPQPLIEALHLLQRDDPSLQNRFQIDVYGNVEARFRSLLSDTPGIQVQWHGQVPYLQSLQKMAASDVLLLMDAPGAVNLFLPSKLIDYFGARKPILGITPREGTTGQLLRDYGFLVAEPTAPEEIATALQQIIGRQEQFAQMALDNDYERFTNDHIAAELHTIFQRLLGED